MSAFVLLIGAAPVYAHGFGERTELPVPLGYFLLGSGAVVALSFAVMGLFVRGTVTQWLLLAVRSASAWMVEVGPHGSIPGISHQGGLSIPVGGRDCYGPVWRPDALCQLRPQFRVDYLVGGHGLRCGADRKCLGCHQSVEDTVRLVGVDIRQVATGFPTDPGRGSTRKGGGCGPHWSYSWHSHGSRTLFPGPPSRCWWHGWRSSTQ